jgi:hypothetical protein
MDKTCIMMVSKYPAFCITPKGIDSALGALEFKIDSLQGSPLACKTLQKGKFNCDGNRNIVSCALSAPSMIL